MNKDVQKFEHHSLSPDSESLPTNTLNIPGGPNGDINVLELEISRRDPFGKFEADEEANLNFYISHGADMSVGWNRVIEKQIQLKQTIPPKTLEVYEKRRENNLTDKFSTFKQQISLAQEQPEQKNNDSLGYNS